MTLQVQAKTAYPQQFNLFALARGTAATGWVEEKDELAEALEKQSKQVKN